MDSNKDPKCLFCRIIDGSLPSSMVLSSEYSCAFLDLYPITEGMTLVIPKVHVKNWWELDDALLAKLMIDAKRVALILHKKYPEKRIGVQIEGLEINHAHIKVFPFSTAEEFNTVPDRSVKPDHIALTRLAAELRGEPV